VQDLLNERRSDPGKIVLYYFFDFSDREQSVEAMISSLVYQLLQHCLEIPPDLDALFVSCENGTRKPSSTSLKEIFFHMLREFPQAYIVLDALDECSNRAQLLGILEEIAALHIKELHLLVLSRQEKDMYDCRE
jgi:hypothetical protein